MDEEVLDIPLDLSIPRSDAGGLQLNNSFSWSGMAEVLSWSDQLLRVKSVMTIAQLNQDWKDEEEVQEEDDQQPWRFDGQFEILEEEVKDINSEGRMAIDESRSLEAEQEFHIFGGEEENSDAASKHFREHNENISRPGSRGRPPSDAITGEESPPVCLEECSLEPEGVFFASQVLHQSVVPPDRGAKEASRSYYSEGNAAGKGNTLSQISNAELPAHEDRSIRNTSSHQQEKTSGDIFQMLSLEETTQESPAANICQPTEVSAQPPGAECQAVFVPLAGLLESLDSREELEVTHVTLLPSPGNMVDEKSLLNIPSNEVESLMDGLALKDLVVIECQTPCEQAGYVQLLLGEEDSNDVQGGCHTLAEQVGPDLCRSELLGFDLFNTLAEQVGHDLCQSELLGIDLFERKVSSDSVSISEVSGELAGKRTLETVLVQCWKGP